MNSEKIYKLIIYLKKNKTITRPFYKKDYASIDGELVKATSVSFNYFQERIFLGKSKEKMLEVLENFKRREEYHSYLLELITIKNCEEL